MILELLVTLIQYTDAVPFCYSYKRFMQQFKLVNQTKAHSYTDTRTREIRTITIWLARNRLPRSLHPGSANSGTAVCRGRLFGISGLMSCARNCFSCRFWRAKPKNIFLSQLRFGLLLTISDLWLCRGLYFRLV